MGEDAGSLDRGRVRYFPVVPGRMEFALEVRRAILAAKPNVVAVELPERLREAYLQAVQRLPQMSVVFYVDEEHEGQAIYAPVEPADPFTEAIRTGIEIGAEILFADPDVQERSDEIARHASGIAWKLQGADPLASVFFVVSLNLMDPVLDAMESPQPELASRPKPAVVQLFNLHPDCLAEVTTEYPMLQERYELFHQTMETPDSIDRPKAQLAVLRTAEISYETNTGEKLAYWQRRLLARFTRNLALTAGQLCAGLFDITVAARSVVDDNFAWEVWDTANRYSFQKPDADVPTVNISGEEVWLDTKRIRLRRRLPSAKRRLRPAGLKARKKEKVPGEWARELNGNSICSYPPEDLVIEDYGRFLKKKGKSILSEERARVEPFTTSILDGIDLRETIRNWHEKRIYVRSHQKVSGEVGSVIVIFDEDHEERYNYCTTWLGEHQNESDMAFYSTFPFDNMVGPGIGRGEYGGFLMSLPARRMFDVWKDPDYDIAESKSERLLLAGLDYSIWKFVVYVAMKPPRTIFRNIATRFGRTIVYIPIGQLSPVTMKKLRVVHVLDGYDKRDIAKEYIW